MRERKREREIERGRERERKREREGGRERESAKGRRKESERARESQCAKAALPRPQASRHYLNRLFRPQSASARRGLPSKGEARALHHQPRPCIDLDQSDEPMTAGAPPSVSMTDRELNVSTGGTSADSMSSVSQCAGKCDVRRNQKSYCSNCRLHEFWRWTIIIITDLRRRALGRGAGGKRLSGAVCGCRGKRRLGAHPTDTR